MEYRQPASVRLFFDRAVLSLALCLTRIVADTQELQSSWPPCLHAHFPEVRADFPSLLNCLGLVQSAVEVGVQAGVHARSFLDGWKGRHLRLVDTWGSEVEESSSDQQLFYVDIANINGLDVRRQHRKQCEARLHEFLRTGRAEIVSMDSVAAASRIPDEELDFVYLDARHDFVGVTADIRAWWPKVKIGGVFAGHDFVDGEFPEGDFFWKSGLEEMLPGLANQTHVTGEKNRYPSFFVIKTHDAAKLQMRSFPTEAFARRLYAQRSRYFKLWRQPGQESFMPVCRETCGRDCTERAKDFTPSLTAGSTLRPFACQETEPQEVLEQNEGASAVAPACSAELVVDVKAYQEVCLERCNVTCQQRHELFSAFAEDILLA